MNRNVTQIAVLAAAFIFLGALQTAAAQAYDAQPTIIIGRGYATVTPAAVMPAPVMIQAAAPVYAAPAVAAPVQQAAITADQITWNAPRLEEAAYAQAETVAAAPQQQQPVAVAAAPVQQIGVMQAMYNPAARPSESLFGRTAVMNSDISAFSKWSQVIELQQKALAAPHNESTQEWLAFIDSIRGLPQAEQVRAVNDYANRVKYVEDIDNYGQQDYWATPEEFFARGGDCEDYAIAKYVSLQMLGFDVSKMRVVILFDQYKQERHAVLAVQEGSDIQILDNLSARVMSASEIDHYTPIYAISQNGWWRFV